MPTKSLPALRHLLPTVAAFIAIAVISARMFGTLTPIWYSNGIAVVALLLNPPRTWAWFLLPMWIGDAIVLHQFGHGPTALLAFFDIVEIVLVAGVLSLTGGIRFPVFEGLQMARVVAVCVLVPMVSAALAAGALQYTHAAPFLATWRGWYTATALGLVIVCPFLLSWADARLRAQAFARVSLRGSALMAGGTLLAAWLVQSNAHQTLVFLSFPMVFALTWMFGLSGATLGMLAVSVSVLWGTMEGRGGIVHMLAGETLAVQLEAAQVYLASLLLSSLPLSMLRARQQELTESLRRAGEARTEFLAAMSHEIRTPMTGVLGMVDLLAAEPLTARQQGYVEALRSSGSHLLSVINDILDFTRIESGRLELEEVDFALGDMLERVRSLVHPLAVERGLALHVDADPEPQQVLRGDPFRLRQVLLNLVSNAVKFTEKGEVTVKVARHRDERGAERVGFEVRDTGVGIAPEQLRRLFEPFTQADRSISRQYGGSGLGLAISRRLVETMGGTMAVQSVPAQGSVFSFEVPLKAGDPSQVVQEAHDEAAPVPPQRILVAEDVEINRELLRAALGRHGHHLSFAHDGAEALQLAEQEPFDLVLMDVQMPVMDGVEATRRIRRLPPPAGQVPIIGLTANVMARERERYLGAGMDDCLGKPIDWEVLHASIARIAGAPPAPAPGTAAPRSEGEAGLIDEGALATLRRMASDDDLAELMRVGMDGYEEGCARMEAGDANAQVLLKDAHKLKGSAGTLGLVAISALAARIESAAEEQGEAAARSLVPPLRAAIDATRAELKRRGLLRATYTT